MCPSGSIVDLGTKPTRHVSADELLFDVDERGQDQDPRLQFEAISRLNRLEKEIVRQILESIIIKHEAAHWLRNRAEAGAQ